MTDYVALIPFYNHPHTLEAVVADARARGLPCLIVDDGSDTASQVVLDRLRGQAGVHIHHRLHNGGKGAAVQDGLLQAALLGFSHAVQIDADGQHNRNDIPAFVAASRQHPQALICGRPVYGADAPKARLYGRKLTNFWIAVNTLSCDIPDGMCGFRVYPLASVNALLAEEPMGRRMDFDIEILVRLYWRGVPMQWLPTAVHYQTNGVSHFHAWRDNVLISRMHARLFFGMWRRLPTLIRRRCRSAPQQP